MNKPSMNRNAFLLKMFAILCCTTSTWASDGKMPLKGEVRVLANEVSHRVSPFTTGACIEDVNHEIYGGIYSQMIFGESFEEGPDTSKLLDSFQGFDGVWTLSDGVLNVEPSAGAKVVSNEPTMTNGQVGVELFFDDNTPGNGGFILRVQKPGKGANAFYGYEISLDPHRQELILGRHRNNWESIDAVPCKVPTEKWIPLTVVMKGNELIVSVNGEEKLRFKDTEHPLKEGLVGLRTWQKRIAFRNLTIQPEGGQAQAVPFQTNTDSAYAAKISGMWRPLVTGSAVANFAVTGEGTFNGKQSQVIEFVSGKGEVGLGNRSLNRWGMCFQAGKPYEGYLWAKASKPVMLYVTMRDCSSQKIYAQETLNVSQASWQRIPFKLTPQETDSSGDFVISLREPGQVTLGHVFLQPGEWGRFKGLPVRKDVVDALIAQGLTVLRYGGCMAEADEYRWKKMIGPPDLRPPYRGYWYPESTNGWGIIDFINLCEAAGFLCIPDFNIDETPQDMVDFVEYVNGPADSVWGKKRVADGHPEPYKLKYIQLGNEETVNETYWKKFKPLAEAIWKADPDITIVVGDFSYNARIDDPFKFRGAVVDSFSAHKKILELAKKYGRTIWFDIHVNNDRPRNVDLENCGMLGMRDMYHYLKQLCPGADFKVNIFEENAGNHMMYRGLAHAHTINEIQRYPEEMPVLCAANCLQPYGQNDNGWDQGMLFLSPSQVWGQPPYYVTQMLSRNYQPLCVKSFAASHNDALDVTACLSEDGKTLSIRVVNMDSRPIKTDLRIDGFKTTQNVASVEVIQGELSDKNTPEEPTKIVPTRSQFKYEPNDGELNYTFPPHSFTIITLK